MSDGSYSACHLCGAKMIHLGGSNMLVCPLHGTRGKPVAVKIEKLNLTSWMPAWSV